MTDEEKKQVEAEKAEAVKTAAAAAETAALEKYKAENPDLAKAQARIAELNEENKKRRLSEKESKELADKQAKAIEILTGKPGEVPDPVKMEREKADSRVKKAFLKSAFVSVAAKDMHDADFAFDAVASEFGDVAVDIETGKVDKEKLAEKVGELKKSRAFLFVTPPAAGGTPPAKQVKNPPDGGGTPGGAGNPYQEWRKLKEAGDHKRAQTYYEKNRAEIAAHTPA